MAQSRHGFIIMYVRCPLHWASQLQTKIALSTTKSEFINLSMALTNHGDNQGIAQVRF